MVKLKVRNTLDEQAHAGISRSHCKLSFRNGKAIYVTNPPVMQVPSLAAAFVHFDKLAYSRGLPVGNSAVQSDFPQSRQSRPQVGGAAIDFVPPAGSLPCMRCSLCRIASS